MQIVDKETGQLVSRRQMKQAHSNITWGNNPDVNVLNACGYAKLVEHEAPQGDVVWQIENELVDGEWHQRWASRDYTTEELAQ